MSRKQQHHLAGNCVYCAYPDFAERPSINIILEDTVSSHYSLTFINCYFFVLTNPNRVQRSFLTHSVNSKMSFMKSHRHTRLNAPDSRMLCINVQILWNRSLTCIGSRNWGSDMFFIQIIKRKMFLNRF